MRIKLVTALCSAVVLVPAVLFAQSSLGQPGLWKITTTMEVKGFEVRGKKTDVPPRTTTSTQCVTEKDMPHPGTKSSGSMPVNNKGCAGNYNVSGNTVSWASTCDGIDAHSISGQMTYSDDGTSYTGLIIRKTVSKTGTPIQATLHITGKRIGDCVP